MSDFTRTEEDARIELQERLQLDLHESLSRMAQYGKRFLATQRRMEQRGLPCLTCRC